MGYPKYEAEAVEPSNNRQIALMAAVESCGNRGASYSQSRNVISVADEFLAWLEGKEPRRY